MRFACLIVLFAFPSVAHATSDLRGVFYGTWGTVKQCSRTPIKSGGTVLSEPFEIKPNTLRHGGVWCNLSWGPIEKRENGIFTAAHAQCGEDSVRSYLLGMELTGNNLKLRWGFPGLSDSLARCPNS